MHVTHVKHFSGVGRLSMVVILGRNTVKALFYYGKTFVTFDEI
jgi:hypothetical protein